MMHHILAVMRVNAEAAVAEALWVRGCQIDNTGPQSFRNVPRFRKFGFTTGFISNMVDPPQ